MGERPQVGNVRLRPSRGVALGRRVFRRITDWVRNLRAAGGGTLRHKGRTEAFHAIEVDGEERERVISAFRAKADRLLNKEYDRLPNASDHPTFRVEAKR